MFRSKQKRLFETDTVTTTATSVKTNNGFILGGLKETSKTSSENGALKYTTTGDDFVDQFGKLEAYKVPRKFSEISKDMELLYSQDPELTLAFTVYMRIISRKTVVLGKTLPVQMGAGLKHESIMRMMWLENKNPTMFYKNLIIFVSAGSWKDVFQMLQYDLVYNGWDGKVLDWTKMGNIIVSGLNTESEVNLVKKYLPQIKAKSKCKTVEAQANVMIAKWICSLLYGSKSNSASYKQYRKLKSSGNAHQWQQLISKGKFDLIDFSKVHGRALNKMVRSKFLENHGLTEKYEKFISNPEVDAVKYTGFVHELFQRMQGIEHDNVKRQTIDKQFNQLVKQAKDSEKFSKLMVVRDTSSSMGMQAEGAGMSCYDLAKALGLYMSEFLSGPFQNHWIEFNSRAQMHEWKGLTATEKWYNDHSCYLGSTNFQSVIDLFCELKTQGIDEADFPTGILCISDGEFNASDLNRTNVETARKKLQNAGFSKQYSDDFVIVLWNVWRNQGSKFDTHGFAPNTFYYSGFDGSTLALLTGDKIKTSRDLFNEAVSQQLMNYLSV